MPKPNYYLLSDFSVPETAKDEPRKFSGIANSGKPFNYHGELTILDLEGLEFEAKLPILQMHDADRRCGFGSLKVADNQLQVEGTFLSNEYGQQVVQDSDEGFPWQMSAYICPSSIEEISALETAEVNQQTVTGPLTILRHSQIREVSFTPLGIDGQTAARALSDNLNAQTHGHTTTDKEKAMSLEQALKKINELSAELVELQKLVDALKKEKETLSEERDELALSAKRATIEMALSSAGFKRTEDGKSWQGLSEATVNLLLSADAEQAQSLINDMRPLPTSDQETPAWLLSEQHPPSCDEADLKLSSNPLLADADTRSEKAHKFI